MKSNNINLTESVFTRASFFLCDNIDAEEKFILEFKLDAYKIDLSKW